MQKLANIWPKDSPGDTCYRNLICKSVTQWRIPLISFNVSPAPPGVVHWNQRGEWNKFHEPNEAACRRWWLPPDPGMKSFLSIFPAGVGSSSGRFSGRCADGVVNGRWWSGHQLVDTGRFNLNFVSHLHSRDRIVISETLSSSSAYANTSFNF